MKKVSFSKRGTEKREATIEPEGFEPFKISFRVPSISAQLDIGMDSHEESRGRAVIRYIANHLEEWDLEPEPTEENVEAIEDVEVLWALFNAISAAGNDRKN